MSQSVSVSTPRSRRSLWRDGNFLTMWSGQASAQFGTQITELTIPVLAVLLLDATEFEVGILGAAGLAAFLVIGLPAGAWIDRLRKRHVMIVANIVRAATLAAVPILWWAGALTMWQLILVATVLGCATVFFDVAYQSIVPSLVRSDQIAEANGKLESTAQLAGIGGPAAGGALVALVSAPLTLLATVGTYLLSFVALVFTRDHETPAERGTHPPLPHSIAEGLGWVFGNRRLRRIVGTTALSNFFGTISSTLLPLFVLRELGFSAQTMGVILALGAAGGLVGAIATPRIVRLVGEARAIPLTAIAFSVAGLLLPVAALVPTIALPVLTVQGFLMMFTVLVYNIVQVTFRQRITPVRLLGRMNASIRFVVWGCMPIAALLAGILGGVLGVVPTLWIGAIGGVGAALFVVTGPFWSSTALPASEIAPADDDRGAR